MAAVYILYSTSSNIYYVGSTNELLQRLDYHLNNEFKHSFTSKYRDWILFYAFDVPTNTVARKIETHIKNMKSRKYIENLKKYPEISLKLLTKYNTDTQSR